MSEKKVKKELNSVEKLHIQTAHSSATIYPKTRNKGGITMFGKKGCRCL